MFKEINDLRGCAFLRQQFDRGADLGQVVAAHKGDGDQLGLVQAGTAIRVGHVQAVDEHQALIFGQIVEVTGHRHEGPADRALDGSGLGIAQRGREHVQQLGTLRFAERALHVARYFQTGDGGH